VTELRALLVPSKYTAAPHVRKGSVAGVVPVVALAMAG
jgi:hypothetical protein